MDKIADIVEANPCMSWFFQELAKDPGQKDAFIQLLKWFNALTPLGTSAIATLDLLGGVANVHPQVPHTGRATTCWEIAASQRSICAPTVKSTKPPAKSGVSSPPNA
jgi:hypothetical protein